MSNGLSHGWPSPLEMSQKKEREETLHIPAEKIGTSKEIEMVKNLAYTVVSIFSRLCMYVPTLTQRTRNKTLSQPGVALFNPLLLLIGEKTGRYVATRLTQLRQRTCIQRQASALLYLRRSRPVPTTPKNAKRPLVGACKN